MKARAIVVDKARGEATRQALVAEHALRTDLEILDDGERLAFPVRTEADVREAWGEVALREFRPREAEPPTEFRELLGWPPELAEQVPRSFDVVGDIVLVRLPAALEPRAPEIGEALLRFVPGARLVGLDRGVEGEERRRRVERLAGTGPWRTRHRENGLALEVDVERAYFSPRLAGEHWRIAQLVRTGERVYDLCCGVGPFALTIASEGRAQQVVAVDANPSAIELLRASLAGRSYGARVTPVESRLEAFVPTAGTADRVVLNLPREGIKYATLVAPLVRPGGWLHFYDLVGRDEVAGHGIVTDRALSALGPWAPSEVRTVHPYSPARDLVSVSARHRTE